MEGLVALKRAVGRARGKPDLLVGRHQPLEGQGERGDSACAG